VVGVVVAEVGGLVAGFPFDSAIAKMTRCAIFSWVLYCAE
jgi:hypothetical protein